MPAQKLWRAIPDFPPPGPAFRLSGFLILLLWAFSRTDASAHTMTYFTWFQVERQTLAGAKELRVIHTCRLDTRLVRADDPLVDSDGDSTVSQRELADLCSLTARYLAQDFLALSFDQPLPSSLDSFSMLEGDTGFRTEIVVPLPEGGSRVALSLMDPAFLVPHPAPAASDAATSPCLVRAEAKEVTLLDTAGHPVRILDQAPAFRTEFTLERPGNNSDATTTSVPSRIPASESPKSSQEETRP